MRGCYRAPPLALLPQGAGSVPSNFHEGSGGTHSLPLFPPQEWAWHHLQQGVTGMRAGGGLPMPLALPPAQGVMNEVSRPPHVDGET